MEITSSEFVISNTDYRLCPKNDKPEYAFVGRSNVGKSSLINMLCRHKGLALTSSKPGKTLLINHFIINNEWYLVDLPGYGYATTGKKMREQLRAIIENYVLYREQLYCLFILIDSRHPAQAIDLEFIRWAGEKGIPIALVFTKADKLTGSQLKENPELYKNKLLEEWETLPPIFVSSAEKRSGREELLDFIGKSLP